MIITGIRRAGYFVSVAAILLSISTPLASAATPGNPDGAFNVIVSPPSIGLDVSPGKSVSSDIKIQNQGLATEHVKISVLKFSAKGPDGTPAIEDIQPGDEFAKWIHFSPARFDAEPRVWKTVKMTLAPPADAAFGYYYAVVFTRDGAEQQTQTKAANLQAAVASLVLVDVKAPGAVRRASIAEFSTTNKVQEFLPTTFKVRMHNTGNTHVAPRGNIVVSKGGKNIALLEVNLKKGFILPDTYRRFDITWSDGTPVYKVKMNKGDIVRDKAGQPVQELSWDNFSLSKLRIGKYNAKLIMVYDDGKGDVSTEANLSFWVMPWRILAGAALVILLLLGGVWAIIIRPIRSRFKGGRSHGPRV